MKVKKKGAAPRWGDILGPARSLLFPERCPGCNEVRDMGEEGFCPRCEETVVRVREPICGICGKMLASGEEEYCALCRKAPHEFLQNKAGMVYSGAVKQAMYAFKYGNSRWIGRHFAATMAREHERWLWLRRPQAIIPVPMYHKKERERGYNQARVLAKALAKEVAEGDCAMAIPVVEPVARWKNTIPQKSLSPYVRRKNLKKAFKMRKNVVELYGVHSGGRGFLYDRVLLVDDIYTTGATLDAIASLLRESGYAREIYGMTAAIGQIV